MIGYRSIGYGEIQFLINSENPVYGRFKYSHFPESGCTLPYGAVSFFVDNIKWHDGSHRVDIVVKIPNDAQKGIATYMAAKSFGDTKIFTGKTGKTEFKVEEIYVRCYHPEDIVSIDLNGLYANHFIESGVKPFCKKYNIKLLNYGKEI